MMAQAQATQPQTAQNRFAMLASQLPKQAQVAVKAKALIEGIAAQMEADAHPEIQACGLELREVETTLIQALQT